MLPAIVIGGWLGAGKTSLVNRLLRAAGGRRIAVMVNDFGAVSIDADLIESREGSVMNLAGGCVCCAVGSDLVEALVGLTARASAFDIVLVETSGVALPASVARALRLVPGIDVEGTVVLADAETVRARADDRHVGDMVRRQLAEADLLVLNKVDLVPADSLPALRAWVHQAAPDAALLETVEAALPPELVLGLGEVSRAPAGGPAPRPFGTSPDTPAPSGTPPRARTLRAPPSAATTFESASFELDGAYDVAALAVSLADPALGLLRAKGVLRAACGGRSVLQAVGPRVRTRPADALSAAAHPDAPTRLVVIGRRGALDAAAVADRVAAARRPDA